VSNTAGAPLNGARVAVIDGPNAGLSVLTNANGSYRFETLSIANMNFSGTATDYLEARAGTFVNGTNGLNFVLTPVHRPHHRRRRSPRRSPLPLASSPLVPGRPRN